MKKRLKERESDGSNCPYLFASGTTTCRAYSNGLKVPTRREEYEYCMARFGLCPLYRRASKAKT